VEDLLSRRPELLQNDAERKLAFHSIAQEIDSRFGEKFYGTMFWNRTLKDSAIASFLSLGWNYGFVHQFGGAAMQAVTRPAGALPAFAPTAGRQVIRDATNKIPFALSYLGSAAVINGLMTYAFTGEMPKGLDYIFARIGGKNPDNSDRRVTNMFYLREYPMLQKHIQSAGGVLSGSWEMVSNKLMYQPFDELLHNKDYYGFNIWDENAPIYKQIWQAMKHTVGEQFSPMSVSGAKYGMELSGKKFDATDPKTWGALTDKSVPLALLGFGPAPRYVEKDAMQNRIQQLFKDHVAPASKTYEDRQTFQEKMAARTAIQIARRDKDPEALRAAIKMGREAGMTDKSMQMIGKQDTDAYLFSRLPKPDQRAILRDSSDVQKNKYLPTANEKVKFEYRDWRREHPASSFNPAYTQ
jgi:hypothetical protein